MGALLESDGEYFQVNSFEWDSLINRDDLFEFLNVIKRNARRVKMPNGVIRGSLLLPPIGTQEVWAGSANYTSSRIAQIKENEATGAAFFYRRAYYSERPQLFFKAPHYRVVGSEALIRFRRDSAWNFPEPELTIFASSSGKIVAYTIGNDMSSGSLCDENLLYLPQAKIHDSCAGLGPCLLVTQEPLDLDTRITMAILRNEKTVFSGETQLKFIKRPLEDMVEYLFRETSFSKGVFLMTGAGVIPTPEFTLQSGDRISITIDGIGTLINVATSLQSTSRPFSVRRSRSSTAPACDKLALQDHVI